MPPYSRLFSQSPVRPFPGMASKEETVRHATFRSSPARKTALASGCSLCFSKDAASVRKSFSARSPNGRISVTRGSPTVIVPVLSSTTMSVFPVCSSEAAVLNKMPCFAPTPLPTIIATGVASPKAHGQLMTSTDMPRASANPNDCPASSQAAIVTAASAITVGTKMPETLSAIFAIGALVAAASSTMRMICESAVFSPTRVARHFKKPDVLSVAAETSSPAFLSTGTLSPVSAASLTALSPSSTTPSVGMLSPGRTTKTSPTLTCSIGTTLSMPYAQSVAVLGAN